MKKNLLKCLVALSLMVVLSLVGVAFADEQPMLGTMPAAFEGKVDNEELFAKYVENLLNREVSGNDAPYATGSHRAGSKLTGGAKTAYNALVPFFKQVAAGQHSSTTFTFDPNNRPAFTASNYTDIYLALDALYSDYPYETYWWNRYGSGWLDWSWVGYDLAQLSFKASDAYAVSGDLYRVNTTKTGAPARALSNAKAIVSNNRSKSDRDKLEAYMMAICDMVDYDHEAVNNDAYSNGVQHVVWTFDGDPSTKIVCGGYARSFQFLCDLSTWQGNVQCYSALGDTTGYHMWNIVSINGTSYLTDVTGCDTGRDGYYSYSYFLQLPIRGSVGTKYEYPDIWSYEYDQATKDLLGTTVLTLPLRVSITTQPKSVTVAKGDAAKVTVSAKGDGLTYTWYVKTPGASSFSKSSVTGKTYSVAMAAARNGTQLYCVVKDKYGYTAQSNTVTMKMQTPLAITTQPKSVTVAKGETAKLTVSATGDGLTYAWYLKAVGKTSFSKSSVTGKTYSVAMTAARSGNQLYCVVKDKYGNTLKSSTVTIKMKPPVTIATQPKSVTVAKGATAKVTVGATGDGLTYAWYLKAVGKTTFSRSSVTGNTYSVAMTAARNGNQLYCVVKDKYGNSVKSNTVTIKMKATPLSITKQPQSVTVAKGATAKVTISATGDGVTYTWYVKAVGKSSFSKSAVTGNTYSVSMTAARNGNQLYCIVKDKYGNSVKSNTVTIKQEPITITAQPKSVTVARGEAARVTVSATGSGLTYTWYVRPAGKTSFTKSAVTGRVYAVTMSDARNGTELYCVVQDQYGNTKATSTVMLKMTGSSAYASEIATSGMLAIENTDPQTVNLSEGGMHTMSITATGGTMPYSYQWYVNKGRGYEAVEGATNATYTTSPADHTSSGYSYYCIVTDGSGNTVTGPVYTVLVAGEDAAPATGDNSLVELWAVLCIISAGACLLLMKRKENTK